MTGRQIQEAGFFAARFLVLARFNFASSFSKAALGTVNTILSALLNRSLGVSPGTAGGGRGFILTAAPLPHGGAVLSRVDDVMADHVTVHARGHEGYPDSV
jgi:hypothetical protein